ncbi:MAG: hypothetical protein VZS44_08640 [Bacilli bacterium]|nr:hypothetical protein [Bacilli bacterium]
MTNYNNIKELIYMFYCVNRKNPITLKIVAAEHCYSQPLFWDVMIYNKDFNKVSFLPRGEAFIRNIVPNYNVNIRVLEKEVKYFISIEIIRIDNGRCFVYENEIIANQEIKTEIEEPTTFDIDTL